MKSTIISYVSNENIVIYFLPRHAVGGIAMGTELLARANAYMRNSSEKSDYVPDLFQCLQEAI